MEYRNGGCEAKLPYPECCVECENPVYARMLSEVYAGADGEFGAIAQYFYWHLVTAECDPELSRTLECISLVEMRHLELLGELIVGLGGDPRIGAYSRRSFEWWSGRHLDYTCNVADILRAGAADEKKAICIYNDLADAIGDRCVSRVLRRIAADEERHQQILENLLARRC